MNCWSAPYNFGQLLSPMVKNARIRLIMVGPVAVVPERQSEGFGQALMLASLSALGPNPALATNADRRS